MSEPTPYTTAAITFGPGTTYGLPCGCQVTGRTTPLAPPFRCDCGQTTMEWPAVIDDELRAAAETLGITPPTAGGAVGEMRM